MTFMERSSYSEAIELNQNFGTGIYFGNAFLNDRVTYQATMTRQDNGASSGAFFGDGQWGWNVRTTALPLVRTSSISRDNSGCDKASR